MQNHRRAQQVCSRAENSAIKKRSIINNNYRGHSLVQTSFTELPNIRYVAEAHNGSWETDRVQIYRV